MTEHQDSAARTQKVTTPCGKGYSEPWWRTAVTYQIYPRSLRDTTGNGLGDLNGITESLDYIADLGVDAIWLSPFYPSPQVDAGYDVADYRDVDPAFGSLRDFDRLVESAHARNLRVVIDLVPNHSSSMHPFFQAALHSPPGSDERALYHFVDADPTDPNAPPNNWTSVFGGPSWTLVPGENGEIDQWYYHLFAPEQPDFNWDDPRVLEYFQDVLRFWLDRGVDGFRIDVSDALIKDTSWPDTVNGSPVIPKDESSRLHDVYREFRKVLDEYPGDRMAVLETGAPDDIVSLLLRPDEMHQSFNLRFLKSPWDRDALIRAIDESLTAFAQVGAGVTWVVDNHDNARSVTRYAIGQTSRGEYVPEVSALPSLTPEEFTLGTHRARAMALVILALPGAAYIYQGQELGLPQVTDLPDEALTDPVFFRTGGTQRGRDGCRVPIPWQDTRVPYGFSTNADTWLPQPENWADLSVESESRDPASMLSWYRTLLQLRKQEPSLGSGDLHWVDSGPDTIHLRLSSPLGTTLELVVNFGEPVPVPTGEVLAASAPLSRSSETDPDQLCIPTDTSALIAV